MAKSLKEGGGPSESSFRCRAPPSLTDRPASAQKSSNRSRPHPYRRRPRKRPSSSIFTTRRRQRLHRRRRSPGSRVRLASSPLARPLASDSCPPSTAGGILHTPLSSNPSPSLLSSPALLPFPTTSSPSLQTPISMTVTQYHYLLLYVDRVCAVGRLDERLVWEERLPLVRRISLGLRTRR